MDLSPKKRSKQIFGTDTKKPAAFEGVRFLQAESANLVVFFPNGCFDRCFDVGNGKGPWVDDWTKWVFFFLAFVFVGGLVTTGIVLLEKWL